MSGGGVVSGPPVEREWSWMAGTQDVMTEEDHVRVVAAGPGEVRLVERWSTLTDGRWIERARGEVDTERRRQACLARTRCRFALAKERVRRWFEALDEKMRVLHGIERGGDR